MLHLHYLIKKVDFDHFYIIVWLVIVLIVIYILFVSYVKPNVYIKDLTEIGFDHVKPGVGRTLRIVRAQSTRRLGSKIPPPYPNGWFAVAEAEELKVKGVLPVDVLGQNLCLYRGEDGLARCVDAYCPHLGANLAVGGSVCGNCIECPFHQWRFDDGTLVNVPGVETAPKGVSIKTWHVAEADGAVWIWHDAEGREPQWTLQNAPELRTWTCRGRNEFTVNCHIQEIPENGADVAHLNVVHSASLFSIISGAHQWSAEWSKGEGHTALMKLTHDFKLWKMNLVHLDVEVTQIGPGHVRLLISSALGPLLISQSVTPLAPLHQRVVHRVFSPARNAPFAAFMNKAESTMIERDIVIWNNKRFVSAPAYVKTDKPIRAFRSWYSQFYSENSLSFRDALNNNLDW